MSHASPYAVLPEDVVRKVNDYAIGLLCSWTPQQMILGHEVSIALDNLLRTALNFLD